MSTCRWAPVPPFSWNTKGKLAWVAADSYLRSMSAAAPHMWREFLAQVTAPVPSVH